ncbi:MAG: hypothetical protein COA45_06460 [Zetaproteobacteria bacterium]|nr:MAG: hypothetical protein COA45_06460 [Zetaproteobacteria bacterium]
MAKSKNEKTLLIGKFEDAHVLVGDTYAKSQDPDDLKKPFHDVDYKGMTYRFVNSDQLSDESIKTLSQQKNAHVFGGDLKGMMISVTSGGIRAEHVPELMPEV